VRSLLVTGGAGFIGANFLLDWLAEIGEPAVNLDLLTYAGNLGNLVALIGDRRYSFVRGSIGDQPLVASLLERHAVRAVVNFAAESHVDRSIAGPAAFIDTNVVGTFNLLEAARAYWQRLDGAGRAGFRFLQVSTDEVYGSLSPDAPAFTEAHPYRPNSPYAASKAAADHLVRAYGETFGLPVLVTNCSNNYGPFHFPEKLIPLVIHNALTGRPLPVYGDGRQVRDWLYVKDHTAALRQVLAGGRPGQAYNIGGGNERTNMWITQQILEQTGASDELITYVEDRLGHDVRYSLDTSKAQRELGWKPEISFDEGLAQTVQWYKDRRDWWEPIKSGEYREFYEKQYAGKV
jgi:dTDP-glucose 4,6-dehydratase